MEIKPMANFLIHYPYYLYYFSTYYNVGIPTEMNILCGSCWTNTHYGTFPAQKQGLYTDALDGLKRRAENMIATRK